MTTKKGATSFYVVIFVTILFTILTVSFLHIFLSEANQSTNSDLSKSAYDSALAGVEDAKVAVLKYAKCKKNKNASGCSSFISNFDSYKNDCKSMIKILNRQEDGQGGVTVEETGSNTSEAANMMQAYTCVKMNDMLKDYRAYLDDYNRIRIIPLLAADKHGASAPAKQFTGVRVKWYSAQNAEANNGTQFMNCSGTPSTNVLCPINTSQSAYNPPVLKVQYLQMDSSYFLSELDFTNLAGTGTNKATKIFKPKNSTTDSPAKITAADMASTNAKGYNDLTNVQCNRIKNGFDSEFDCEADIQLPDTFYGLSRLDNAVFLAISMPYGQTSTDFSVEICYDSDNVFKGDCRDKNGETNDKSRLYFKDVQTAVDSTGRANDLYRRVESRIEMIDTTFPYPEFAIENTGNDALSKNFWVTKNCQTIELGVIKTCPNNGTSASSSTLNNVNLVNN